MGESRPAASWFQRTLLIERLSKFFYMVRESGLDFVIARPTRLTNGRAKGRYVRSTELASVPSTISRADLADFLVESCESPTFVGKGVQLGG